MLKRHFRLKNKKEFNRVYNEGKSVYDRYLVLSYIKRENREKNIDTPRIGFAVSRKLGGAVERNKVKRIMREAIKPQANKIKPYHDIIFIGKRKIKGISYGDVEKSMLVLLMKAGLLDKDEKK